MDKYNESYAHKSLDSKLNYLDTCLLHLNSLEAYTCGGLHAL